MSYYDVIIWGISGKGSVLSGGDGSLIFTAYDKDDSVIVAPSTQLMVESPSGSGNYILRVPGFTPVAGDYGVVSDGVVGPGHQISWALTLPNSGGSGSGDVAIDHNGGTGVTVNGIASAPDCMRIVLAGNVPVDDAEIAVFTLADYNAGNTGTAFRQATTRTKDDGRWMEPIMLSAGSYKLLVNAQGDEVLAADIVVS